MGRGSNLLVRDGGIDGLVIHPSGGDFAGLEVDAGRWKSRLEGGGVEAGQRRGSRAGSVVSSGWRVSRGGWRQPAHERWRNGRGNFRQVISLRCVDANGDITEKTPKELEIHYRDVPSLKKVFALAATVSRDARARSEEIQRLLDLSSNKRKTIAAHRRERGMHLQKSVEGMSRRQARAGTRIERIRASARRACRRVHGNFIVNDGGASASDVLALIEIIKTDRRATSAASVWIRKCRSSAKSDHRRRAAAASHLRSTRW